jgi:hypothetical protein
MFRAALVLCAGLHCVRAVNLVDATTLTNKFLMGYQGWFATPCDGYDIGWSHWSRGNKTPGPDPDLKGYLNFDSWPDMTEFAAGELCATDLKYANGTRAGLYSNANAQTVKRHFQWMETAGVDGVWKQRFISGMKNPKILKVSAILRTR